MKSLFLLACLHCTKGNSVSCNIGTTYSLQGSPQHCSVDKIEEGESFFISDVLVKGFDGKKSIGFYYPYSTEEMIPLSMNETLLSMNQENRHSLSPYYMSYTNKKIRHTGHSAVICSDFSCIYIKEAKKLYVFDSVFDFSCPSEAETMVMMNVENQKNLQSMLCVTSNKNIITDESSIIFKSSISAEAPEIFYLSYDQPRRSVFYRYKTKSITKTIRAELDIEFAFSGVDRDGNRFFFNRIPSHTNYLPSTRDYATAFINPFCDPKQFVFSSFRLTSTVYDLLIQPHKDPCEDDNLTLQSVLEQYPTPSYLRPEDGDTMGMKFPIQEISLNRRKTLEIKRNEMNLINSFHRNRYSSLNDIRGIKSTTYNVSLNMLYQSTPLVHPPNKSNCALKTKAAHLKNIADVLKDKSINAKDAAKLIAYTISKSFPKVILKDRRESCPQPNLLLINLGTLSSDQELYFLKSKMTKGYNNHSNKHFSKVDHLTLNSNPAFLSQRSSITNKVHPTTLESRPIFTNDSMRSIPLGRVVVANEPRSILSTSGSEEDD